MTMVAMTLVQDGGRKRERKINQICGPVQRDVPRDGLPARWIHPSASQWIEVKIKSATNVQSRTLPPLLQLVRVVESWPPTDGASLEPDWPELEVKAWKRNLIQRASSKMAKQQNGKISQPANYLPASPLSASYAPYFAVLSRN